MTVDPKIVRRIQKLHAMSESAREVGSLAEADSFMEAVQKTLNAHNLDMSVLSLDVKEEQDPMGVEGCWGVNTRHQKRPVAWAQDLAVHVARAHNCACLVSQNSSYVFFVGRQSNRGVALRMFKYLRDMAERLSWPAYVLEVNRRRATHGSEKGAGQFRLNWLEGFVAEVGDRYQNMRERAERDHGMQLVLVSVRKEAADEAARRANPGKETKQMVSAVDRNFGARMLGREAAREINLKPEVLETDERTTRSLTS